MSRHHCSVLVGVMATSLTLAMPALAMETEITIDQDKAMAGGITPGDEPGFPIDINRPGRYVLKSNLYPGPSNGIEIRSHDVTIDFNGFRLQGFGQGNNGILAFGDTGTIMNGVIAGFRGMGIMAQGSLWTVENMRILVNGSNGVLTTGHFGRIERNTIAFSENGIMCGTGCLITNNNVNSNRADGINLFSGTVLGNAIFNNVGFGIRSDPVTGVDRTVGFGNNTLSGNNHGDVQVLNASPLQPNVCRPRC
jgi:hypothetical protein